MVEPSSLRIAYLGPKGSFTHQAALQVFPTQTLEPHVDFHAIFHSISNSTIDRGIVPVENSTNGFVVQILDLFAADYSVSIVGETHVAVQQSLLGRKRRNPSPSSEDVEDWSRIKTLYSHPQAWGQCIPFLTEHLRHAERIDTTSTSKAAEVVAQDESGESAAICSPLAAELYGLDVLVPSIEQRKGNTTRFLVLQKSSDEVVETHEEQPQIMQRKYKTLISFTIHHTKPASLANALAVFGKHEINMTSLNSRPQGERKWNYIFFVEFWGRKGEAEVKSALREVADVVEGFKWIGSWISTGDEG